MGKRLFRLRKAAGYTQETFAAAAGIPLASLRNYEQDRRVPRLDAAARMARVLSISLDTLAECVGGAAALPVVDEDGE